MTGKWPSADCECGWSISRPEGFTKREAYEAVHEHWMTDCPLPVYAAVRAWRDG